MNHLQSLVMKGDNLEGFHNTWNMVLSELTFVPDSDTLLYWYFKQIQHFKPMSEDIAHFKRAQWNKSPDHSFEWLYGAACRYLAQKRSDHMQEALNRSLNSKPNHAAPGVTPPGIGNGKGAKTGVCFSFQKGTCTRGKDCPLPA